LTATDPPTLRASEVLTLGVPDETGSVVLVRPDADVPLGGRLY
jgi:tRNA-binding protein